MAINSKDIEALWKRYSDEGVKKGISVVQFFESNGVPYHTFEKWYKKKFSEKGIVDCVVGGLPDGTVQIPDSEMPQTLKPERSNEVYVSYVNIGLNPRPHEETIRFLHAYSRLHFRATARPGPPTGALSSKISSQWRGTP